MSNPVVPLQSAPPPTVLEWLAAYSGPNSVVPGGGLQASGYAPDDKPTAENLNWIFQNLSYWLAWLYQGWDLPQPFSSGPVTVAVGLQSYFLDTTSGSIVCNLLQSSAVPGMRVRVKNTGFGTANIVTMTPFTGDALEGAAVNATSAIPAGECWTWEADGLGNWYIVARA